MSEDHGIGGFLDFEPSEIDNFRGIVLFGMNTASFKFALAKSLIDLVAEGKDRASLDELAVPFSAHLTQHLANSPRQIKAASSKFLDICRDFNQGDATQEALISATVRLGFNNVIDAFHTVGGSDVST